MSVALTKVYVYQQANINLKNLKLISAILVGALYPNVVQVMTPQSKFNQSSAGNSNISF